MLKKKHHIIFSQDSKNNNFYGINEIINNLIKKINNKKNIKVENVSLNKFFKISNKIKNSNLVHIHGCWSLIHIIVFIYSKIYKKKIFFSPHGMLMPKALEIKSLKKKIALFLYQKNIIKNCNKVIVNSELEKKTFKRIFNHNKIIVIPHGINVNKKNYFIKKKNKKLNFVFFSRIHPIKGLSNLVKIWKDSSLLKNINLTIYGKNQDDLYFKKIKPFFGKNIKYLGQLNTINKYKKLRKYDVLIYPSLSENFGIIILEALNAGLFVLIKKNLPWNFLPKEYGRLIAMDKKNLEKQVISLINKKKNSYIYKNKANLRKYLINKFSWEKIANKYLNQYNIM
tara:strand:- start:2985 stop:4004 length:1020 start_codon:yes stop_codon:yes gene_type:complete